MLQRDRVNDESCKENIWCVQENNGYDTGVPGKCLNAASNIAMEGKPSASEKQGRMQLIDLEIYCETESHWTVRLIKRKLT